MRSLYAALALFLIADTAHAGDACLNMSMATRTTFPSQDEMRVETRDNTVFAVRFHRGCRVTEPRTHFVYEPWTLGPCLRHGQAFTTNHGGVCVVDDVSRQG
jgi:hypothetical protein